MLFFCGCFLSRQRELPVFVAGKLQDMICCFKDLGRTLGQFLGVVVICFDSFSGLV